jgi:hypothetical protein
LSECVEGGLEVAPVAYKCDVVGVSVHADVWSSLFDELEDGMEGENEEEWGERETLRDPFGREARHELVDKTDERGSTPCLQDLSQVTATDGVVGSGKVEKEDGLVGMGESKSVDGEDVSPGATARDEALLKLEGALGQSTCECGRDDCGCESFDGVDDGDGSGAATWLGHLDDSDLSSPVEGEGVPESGFRVPAKKFVLEGVQQGWLDAVGACCGRWVHATSRELDVVACDGDVPCWETG